MAVAALSSLTSPLQGNCGRRIPGHADSPDLLQCISSGMHSDALDLHGWMWRGCRGCRAWARDTQETQERARPYDTCRSGAFDLAAVPRREGDCLSTNAARCKALSDTLADSAILIPSANGSAVAAPECSVEKPRGQACTHASTSSRCFTQPLPPFLALTHHLSSSFTSLPPPPPPLSLLIWMQRLATSGYHSTVPASGCPHHQLP